MANTAQPPIAPPPEEGDGLFRLQMNLANVMFGYWKHGLGGIGVILVIAFVYGTVSNYLRNVQRDLSADIAEVDRGLPEPDPLAAYGLASADDLSDPQRVAALEKSAAAYETIARRGSGAGEAEAWLKAGDIWVRANRKDKAIDDFRDGMKAGEGILSYSSGNRLAVILVEQGKRDEAIATWRQLATEQTGYLAESALIEIMKADLQAGNADAVRKTAAEFKVRFAKSPRLEVVTQLEVDAASKAGGTGS